ncbi:hypothetical protein HY450_01910 [Candidatus Pacearchaeota archaeon]|nr:hypothetical protein [Candidatus Pacearchaeota archaeon]
MAEEQSCVEPEIIDYAILYEILSHVPVNRKINNLEKQLLDISVEIGETIFAKRFPINKYHYSPNLNSALGEIVHSGSIVYLGPSLEITAVKQGAHNMAGYYSKQTSKEDKEQLALIGRKIKYD